MTKYFHHSLLILATLAAASLTAACGGGSPGDDDSSSGGTSGTGGTGGTGGGVCVPGGNIVLAIDPSGWMDRATPCNDDLGVQGAWYPYGDKYGDGATDAKCTKWGGHTDAECAAITTPDPATKTFTNTNGAMHTEGTVEAVLPCVAGSMAATIGTSGCTDTPSNDYASMWGAGIGFDVNSTGGDNSTKSPWDPAAHAVVGLRFTIDTPPAAGLRVEFPMVLLDSEGAADTPVALPPGSTTDSHSKGAPYWGAQKNGDNKWPASPVMPGVNTILFATDVQPPVLGAYVFDTKRLLGVQFHIPTKPGSTGPYNFTISNVEFLRDPNAP